jgi:hypothetical protein
MASVIGGKGEWRDVEGMTLSLLLSPSAETGHQRHHQSSKIKIK